MAVTLDEALVQLEGSPLAEVVKKLVSNVESEREAGADALTELEGQKLDEKEAQALLCAATQLAFPPAEFDWQDPASDLLALLWNLPHVSLIEPARRAYGPGSDGVKRALLALVGATGTREGAEAFVACIRDHGWPSSVYQRIFWELARLEDHADVLFPDLVEHAGDFLVDVGNVLLAALQNGKLVRSQVVSVTPPLLERLQAVLAAARSFQRTAGVAWRFGEEYAETRSLAGFLLDLAGHLNREAAVPLLIEGAQLEDPWLQLFASVSLLRHAQLVDSETLLGIAACHETRGPLHSLLKSIDRIELFPESECTHAAFAAADMVNWLKYPTELAREPDELELMERFEVDELELYVWRFRNLDDDRGWLAGVSGPYVIDAPAKTVSGSSTFSRFESWDSATAEEHAASTLETVKAIHDK